MGRPVITSKNTLVGNRVKESNTGYVVEDTLESLSSVFDGYGTNAYKADYEKKCANCSRLWERDYKYYKEERLEGDYINLLIELSGNKRI